MSSLDNEPKLPNPDEKPPQFATFKEMQAYMATNYPDMLSPRVSKFAPKLTFTERCEALALSKARLDRRVIAAAYGINRATLAFIVNDNSPHYKDVRKEYREMQHERFLTKYIGPTVMERYTTAAKDLDVAYSDDELRAAKGNGETGSAPNKLAIKNAGPFFFSMPLEHTQLRGEVVWADNPGVDPTDMSAEPKKREAGWFILVPDWGDEYQGANDSRHTSTKAKQHFITANGVKEIEE